MRESGTLSPHLLDYAAGLITNAENIQHSDLPPVPSVTHLKKSYAAFRENEGWRQSDTRFRSPHLERRALDKVFGAEATAINIRRKATTAVKIPAAAAVESWLSINPDPENSDIADADQNFSVASEIETFADSHLETHTETEEFFGELPPIPGLELPPVPGFQLAPSANSPYQVSGEPESEILSERKKLLTAAELLGRVSSFQKTVPFVIKRPIPVPAVPVPEERKEVVWNKVQKAIAVKNGMTLAQNLDLSDGPETLQLSSLSRSPLLEALRVVLSCGSSWRDWSQETIFELSLILECQPAVDLAKNAGGLFDLGYYMRSTAYIINALSGHWKRRAGRKSAARRRISLRMALFIPPLFVYRTQLAINQALSEKSEARPARVTPLKLRFT